MEKLVTYPLSTRRRRPLDFWPDHPKPSLAESVHPVLPVMGMSVTETVVIKPPIGFVSHHHSQKRLCLAFVRLRRGKIGNGRAKRTLHAAEPLSPEVSTTKSKNSPTPFTCVKGDSPISYVDQFRMQKLKYESSFEAAEKTSAIKIRFKGETYLIKEKNWPVLFRTFFHICETSFPPLIVDSLSPTPSKMTTLTKGPGSKSFI